VRRCVLALVLLAACGGRAGSDDAAGDDASTDGHRPDAECTIWECQAFEVCNGGVVSWSGGADTDGQCFAEDPCPDPLTYACAEGCDVNGAFFDPAIDPSILCHETPTKMIGDPCGCLPTRAIPQPDGSVLQQYLTCGANNLCEAAEPPVVDGWLGPCAAINVPADYNGAKYSSDGWCLVQSVGGTCSESVKTIDCIGDWQCPQGASCDDSLAGAEGGAFCRPGARGAPLDLGC
jgi:hypothetical protein